PATGGAPHLLEDRGARRPAGGGRDREGRDDRPLQPRPGPLQREPARPDRGAGGPRGPHTYRENEAAGARGARLSQRGADQARVRVPALARELPAGRRAGRSGPPHAPDAVGYPGSRRRRYRLPRPSALLGRAARDERKAPVAALTRREARLQLVEPCAECLQVQVDERVDLSRHGEISGAAVVGNGRVDVEERRRDGARIHLVDLGSALGPPPLLCWGASA